MVSPHPSALLARGDADDGRTSSLFPPRHREEAKRGVFLPDGRSPFRPPSRAGALPPQRLPPRGGAGNGRETSAQQVEVSQWGEKLLKASSPLSPRRVHTGAPREKEERGARGPCGAP
eukprot:scaffold32217_cov27-Tisochrysis_lutea.AAC.6